MALPVLLESLHSDVLRQLDEEGWIVSAEDDQSFHLVSDEVRAERYVFIRLLERDDEVVARIELMVQQKVTEQRQCSAPATNVANLLDVALGLAGQLLGR